MIDVIGTRFNKAGKIYYFDPAGVKVNPGDYVIVETVRGVEMGYVALGNHEVEDKEVVQPLKPIIRVATDEDMKRVEDNKVKSKEAFKVALKKIEEHNLEMKLIDVEYTFDTTKILFYFTADGRVDFRELVKSLASVFRTRIELRQIGVRDEAKYMGGLGICGRFLCCSSFLDEFQSVSIKMAKEQSLSLNPTKISGVCGRLMCCLQYEQSTYEEMLKLVPRSGAIVNTPDGQGTVIDVNVLKGTLRVKLDKKEEIALKTFNVKEIKIIKDVEMNFENEMRDLENLE